VSHARKCSINCGIVAPMKTVDYIIVGQGIAGSCLAYFLLQQNQSVLVVDDGHKTAATSIAAGLMDYISGKRFAVSWQAQTLIPFAQAFYKQLETEWNASFYIEQPSTRFFSNPTEEHYWQKKITQDYYKPFYDKPFTVSPIKELTGKNGVTIKGTSAIKPPIFLARMRQFLREQDALMETSFDVNQCQIEPTIDWQGIRAKKLIFASGHHITKLPWTQQLPYRISKGETLSITCKNLQSIIANKGKWLVPMGTNKFKFGATYEWDDLAPKPTALGYNELTTFLKEWLTCDYQVDAVNGGVRCAVTDLRPLCGNLTHNIGVFSGMGSKGIMMAPYYAHQMAHFLCNGTELDTEVSMERFK